MYRLTELALQVAFRSGTSRFMQLATRHEAVILNFHCFRGDGEGVPGGCRFASSFQTLSI